MRLLVDLTSVSGGGGLEQSSALLKTFETENPDLSAVCIVRPDSQLTEALSATRFDIVTIKTGIASRVFHYLFGLGRLAYRYEADLIYIPFGIGGLSWGACPQIINVAYPILCYPDSPFWAHLSFLSRLRIEAKCLFRRISIRLNANALIAESELMASRLVRHAGFARKILSVIPPIVGRTAYRIKDVPAVIESDSKIAADGVVRLLFITNAAPHKNVWRLGEMAERLANSSRKPVIFALTIDRSDYVKACARARTDDLLARHEKDFLFLGTLQGDELIQQINAADAIVNIADLESISNNFIEATFAQKPMIIAPRDFALLSVRTPFVICEPHEPGTFVEAMDSFRSSSFKQPSSDHSIAVSGKEKAFLLFDVFNRTMRKGA